MQIKGSQEANLPKSGMTQPTGKRQGIFVRHGPISARASYVSYVSPPFNLSTRYLLN